MKKKLGQHQYKRMFDCLILLCMVQQLSSCYLGVDLKLGGTETFDETIKGHYENIIYDLEKSAKVTTYRNVPEQLADHDYNTTSSTTPKPEKISKKERSSRAKDKELHRLKKANKLLQNKLDVYNEGNVPKTVAKKVVEKSIGHKFTPAQIHQILKPTKNIIKTGKRRGKRAITRWAIYPIFVSQILVY